MAAGVIIEFMSPCQVCGRVHFQIQIDHPCDGLVCLQRAVAALTPQEYEVFTCMAGGLSNRELADALAVTVSTVKAHVTKIRRKLAVGAREHVVVAALIYNAWCCAMDVSTDGQWSMS